MLQSKGPYPQVIEPRAGGYWIEGFIEKRQSDSDHMLRVADLDSSQYEILKSDALNYYKEHFKSQVSSCIPPQLNGRALVSSARGIKDIIPFPDTLMELSKSALIFNQGIVTSFLTTTNNVLHLSPWV